MAQGRSTKIISTIAWTRTSRLSITISLSESKEHAVNPRLAFGILDGQGVSMRLFWGGKKRGMIWFYPKIALDVLDGQSASMHRKTLLGGR